MTYRRYFTQYGGLAGLGIIYIILVIAYSAVIPFSKGPDEYINYQYILFIAQNHHLPATLAEKQAAGVKADWQPLYHLVGGLVSSFIPLPPPPELKATWEPPTRRLIDLVLPRATLVRTEDESAPYRGVYAVWQMGRWVSLILGLGALLVTYCIGLTLWPGQPALATGLTALLVFIPRFLFTHAVLSDDTMLGFCLALYLLCLTRLIVAPGRRAWWLFAGLGLTAGLAIVTKYTAIPAAAGALITIGWAARRQHWSRRDWLTGAALFLGALAVSVGWWVGWVWWHFNQVSVLGPVLGLVKPLLPGATVDDNPTTARLTTLLSGQSVASLGEAPGAGGNWGDWLQHTFTTLWGVTVYGAEPGWPYPYNIILVGVALLTVAAVIGGWRVYRRTEAAHQLIWQVFILHLLLFFPLPLLRFALSGRLNDAAQGRHLLFPAGPVIAALLLAGGLAWFRPPWRSRVSLIIAGAMLAWGMGHLIYLWTAYPPPLPVRTTPGPQIEVEHRLGVNFGDILQLNGYQTRLNGSILQLDLAWQSLAQANEDYRTEITLVDRQGQPQLRWLSQPANGRFPTRAWQLGDLVRDTLYIPLAGLPAGEYEVRLRLLGWAKPLALTQGETLSLTTLTLNQPLTSPSIALWFQDKIIAGSSVSLTDSLTRIFTPAPLYRYRSTVPVTLPQPDEAALVGPDGKPRAPAAAVGHLAVFMVDYDWPSGEYELTTRGVSSGLKLSVQNFDSWNFIPPPMMYPAQANFDNKIELLGYDLPTRRVKPGEGIPLVLYWRGLTQMRDDYTISVQLLDANLQRRGGYDRFPRENYNTYLWVPGEIVDDGFAVPTTIGSTVAPDGIYTIRIGWYRLQGGQAAPLPLMQNGHPLAETSVVIGPVKVGGAPSSVVANAGAGLPEHPLQAVLGETIALEGYDFNRKSEALRLKLYWRSLAQTEDDYTVFVHVRDAAGQTVAQMDKPPTDGQYPTSLWDPGDRMADTFVVNLPALARGKYAVSVGLYNPTTGVRLAVPGAADNSVLLTEINLD